jgi:PHD/YefM family antitoxin component YafN of YafNO toxin-antitoxin module
MENTSPKKLKAKLKDFLKLAKKEVVRIKRKSGQRFILVSEKKYNELKLKLNSIPKRLLKEVRGKEKSKSKEKYKTQETGILGSHKVIRSRV